MNRGELMDTLRQRGVDTPEHVTNFLDTEVVESTLSWFDRKRAAGQSVGTGLLVKQLLGGGVTNHGREEESVPTRNWWQTSAGRCRWIDAQVPDLDPAFAEAAICSLTQKKTQTDRPLIGPREPTPELVRHFAELAELQQAEHDKVCRGGRGQ